MSDFVTFEIAKKLKEKGYPQNMCDDGYIIEKDNYGYFDIGDRESIWMIPNYLSYIAAPTIAQALKWLREKGIHIQSEICVSGWYCSIYTFSKDEKGLYDVNDMYLISGKIYDDYEQCTLTGIEYTLDNLI